MLLHKLLAVPQPAHGQYYRLCVCVRACANLNTQVIQTKIGKENLVRLLRKPIKTRISREKKILFPKWKFTTLTKSKLLWWLSDDFLIFLIFILPARMLSSYFFLSLRNIVVFFTVIFASVFSLLRTHTNSHTPGFPFFSLENLGFQISISTES